MFLKPTEHLIFYNTQTEHQVFQGGWIALEADGIRQLHEECGIDVALEMTMWHGVETRPGQRDWRYVDHYVERCQKGGMRVMLSAPFTVPQGLPQAWYAAYQDGSTYYEQLSFWHPDAEAYQRDYLQQLVDRYSGADVTVILWGFAGGETYLWNNGVYYDAAARRSYQQRYGSRAELPPLVLATAPDGQRYFEPLAPEVKAWLQDGIVAHQLNMQSALVGQHHEVWDNTSYRIGLQSESNGNYACPAVFAAYRKTWPDATRWTCQFSYWQIEDHFAVPVDDLLRDYGTQLIVEADYCRGLVETPSTAERAIVGGKNHVLPEQWRGQIVSPLHKDICGVTGVTTMQPWMLDAMKRAVDTWRTARD